MIYMTVDDIKILLSEDVQEFISRHENDDVEKLLLKYHSSELPLKEIAQQLLCRRKARKKFPTISFKPLLYHPTALEQCSSEATAVFKRELLKGEEIIDLTGGLGIDILMLESNFKKLTYCEQNPNLAELFRYNSPLFSNSNIEIIEGDSLEFLKKMPGKRVDWIYLDPARREGNTRSVDLDYCTPNVYENLDLFKRCAKNICIKVSPAFDFTEAGKKIPGLTEFIVVSVNNECKEVLLIIKQGPTKPFTLIRAAGLDVYGKEKFNFALSSEKNYKKNIPEKYLNYFYEPDTAIIKARLTGFIAAEFNIMSFNRGSDFLTSEKLNENFPGRAFRIREIMPFKGKVVRKYLEENKIYRANISKRDFPLQVKDIRKKINLKEGGDIYLFFTRNYENNLVVVAAGRV